MANKLKVIEIELTDEQIKALQPLLKLAEKNSMEGFIFAQAYPEKGLGVARFAFLTPDEVIERLNASERRERPFEPRVWGRVKS